MSMSKKDFIALANAIREHNVDLDRNSSLGDGHTTKAFNESQINTLADFCQTQNPEFKRGRWLGYIAGENGQNGGAHVKVRTGLCKVCGHYGDDCTGKAATK